jgi:hypothetical protein
MIDKITQLFNMKWIILRLNDLLSIIHYKFEIFEFCG